MVNYFLPTAAKNKDWLVNTIFNEAVLPMLHHKSAQALSLVMILIACTGIFLPLEVALNQAWGVTKSRNYLFNQTIAFGLAILMAALALLSMIVTVGVKDALGILFFHQHERHFRLFANGISYVCLAVSTGAASILFLFSVYYVLPNRKVPWRPVLRTSIITGIIWLLRAVHLCVGRSSHRSEHVRPVLHLRESAVLGVYLGADHVCRSAVQRGADGGEKQLIAVDKLPGAFLLHQFNSDRLRARIQQRPFRGWLFRKPLWLFHKLGPEHNGI